ncbi:hypothetical protein ACHQM5_005261 [Ranunculus cassubicifolius]
MARFFPVLFLICLLLTASEFGAEARQCESPSHRFHGICISDRNCASVCHSEGFYTGNCHGFRKRCLCGKPCPLE